MKMIILLKKQDKIKKILCFFGKTKNKKQKKKKAN